MFWWSGRGVRWHSDFGFQLTCTRRIDRFGCVFLFGAMLLLNSVTVAPTSAETLSMPSQALKNAKSDEGASLLATPFDFDGDQKTDVGVYRASMTTSEWWIINSSTGQTVAVPFGTPIPASDAITPADYTGDGKTDISFFRRVTGEWFVLRSEDNTYYMIRFGVSGDVPAPGDYDGDGKADLAQFRPTSGNWYIALSGGGTRIFHFGLSSDIPVVADYDGDHKSDVAIFRRNNGFAEWWIDRSSAGLIALQFGAAGSFPVQGDYTGDQKADVAVWESITGNWYVLRSENFSYYGFTLGSDGDRPAPGDYDGDGKTDPTLYRPVSNTWYIAQSSSGMRTLQFGAGGDYPIANAYVPCCP